MSKYIRRRPPRGLEIDTDFYAFGSPNDYLSYDISDFSSPDFFMAQKRIQSLKSYERIRYVSDVYGKNWTSNVPSASISGEEFDHDYDKAISEQNPYLEMFESYEQDAAAPFTDFAEFMEYMTDVYGKRWTSDVSSESLSEENPFKDYDEALFEIEHEEALCSINDQSFINEWLYGPSNKEHELSSLYFDELQNAHDSMKTRRSKRRMSTIRFRTKLIKQFIPGSGFLWKRYKKADDGNYDHLSNFWEELADGDISHRFRSRVKLAAHYEGYFLVAGRFVKYDPTPKEAKLTVAHDDASVISDAENKHSKFYIPEVPFSNDPVWNAIMKSFQEYLLQHSPKYHGNISYLPKKRLHSCVKQQDMVHKGTEIVTSNIRSHNKLPKIYHMPLQLRHFIKI